MCLFKVAIFGAPRSGTSWLGQLFNSSPNTLYRYQPLFSYEFKDRLTPKSSKFDISKFHSDLIKANSEFVRTKLRFPKEKPTHLVWKEVRYHHITSNLLKNSNLKIIYIERNPVDVINSWYNASKEYKPEWSIQEEWLDAPLKNLNRPEEFNGFNKWLEVKNIHEKNIQNYPDRIIKVEYEGLKRNPIEELKILYKFCNLNWSPQTEDFILKSTTKHENDSYSVFKKQNTVLNLPQNIINQINETPHLL